MSERRLRFEAKAKAKRGEMYIYDQIGESWWGGGVSDKMVAAALKEMGAVDSIDVRINSEGGSVFDAFAIYRLLADHPAEVVVHVDGLAASAASLIAMAGNRIIMAEASYLMIHQPSTMALGNSSELREIADLLDSMNDVVIGVYAARSGIDREQIAQMMADETWIVAADAVEQGWADELAENLRMVAHADLSRFRNVPRALSQERASTVGEDALREKLERVASAAERRLLHLAAK